MLYSLKLTQTLLSRQYRCTAAATASATTAATAAVTAPLHVTQSILILPQNLNFSSFNNARKSNLVFLESLQRKLCYELYTKFIKHQFHSLLVKRACQNVTKIYFLTSCDLKWPLRSILNYSLLHNLNYLHSIKHTFKFVALLEANIQAL